MLPSEKHSNARQAPTATLPDAEMADAEASGSQHRIAWHPESQLTGEVHDLLERDLQRRFLLLYKLSYHVLDGNVDAKVEHCGKMYDKNGAIFTQGYAFAKDRDGAHRVPPRLKAIHGEVKAQGGGEEAFVARCLTPTEQHKINAMRSAGSAWVTDEYFCRSHSDLARLKRYFPCMHSDTDIDELHDCLRRDFARGIITRFCERTSPLVRFFIDLDVEKNDLDYAKVREEIFPQLAKGVMLATGISTCRASISATVRRMKGQSYKTGIHVVFQDVLVTIQQALAVREVLLSFRPAYFTVDEWEKTLDKSLYGASGKLRMIFQHKPKQECSTCLEVFRTCLVNQEKHRPPAPKNGKVKYKNTYYCQQRQDVTKSFDRNGQRKSYKYCLCAEHKKFRATEFAKNDALRNQKHADSMPDYHDLYTCYNGEEYAVNLFYVPTEFLHFSLDHLEPDQYTTGVEGCHMQTYIPSSINTCQRMVQLLRSRAPRPEQELYQWWKFANEAETNNTYRKAWSHLFNLMSLREPKSVTYSDAKLQSSSSLRGVGSVERVGGMTCVPQPEWVKKAMCRVLDGVNGRGGGHARSQAGPRAPREAAALMASDEDYQRMENFLKRWWPDITKIIQKPDRDGVLRDDHQERDAIQLTQEYTPPRAVEQGRVYQWHSTPGGYCPLAGRCHNGNRNWYTIYLSKQSHISNQCVEIVHKCGNEDCKKKKERNIIVQVSRCRDGEGTGFTSQALEKATKLRKGDFADNTLSFKIPEEDHEDLLRSILSSTSTQAPDPSVFSSDPAMDNNDQHEVSQREERRGGGVSYTHPHSSTGFGEELGSDYDDLSPEEKQMRYDARKAGLQDRRKRYDLGPDGYKIMKHMCAVGIVDGMAKDEQAPNRSYQVVPPQRKTKKRSRRQTGNNTADGTQTGGEDDDGGGAGEETVGGAVTKKVVEYMKERMIPGYSFDPEDIEKLPSMLDHEFRKMTQAMKDKCKTSEEQMPMGLGLSATKWPCYWSPSGRIPTIDDFVAALIANPNYIKEQMNKIKCLRLLDRAKCALKARLAHERGEDAPMQNWRRESGFKPERYS